MGTATVNPSIILDAQAPKPTDALESYARVQALKNQLGQQQLQQQQIQAGGLENQQRQLQLDQMHALNKGYSDSINADGTIDTDKLLGSVVKSGHAELAPKIVTQQAELQKTLSDAGKSRLETANLQADAAGSFGKQLQTGGYDPQLFLHGAQLAVKNKAVDPQSLMAPVQAVQKSLLADPTGEQAKQIVKQFSDQAIASSEKWSALQSQQKTAEAAAARGEAAKGELAINQAKLPGAITQQQLANTELTQKTTGSQPITPEQKARLAQGAQRVVIEGANASTNAGRLAVERQRLGFETEGGVSPQAKMIASGNLDPQTTRSLLRSNPGLIGQIKQVDPDFDEGSLDNRYNTLKEFSSSSNTKAGGQVLALNTLIHHADLYQQVADSLNNGSFVPGNAVYNAVAKEFGSAPPTNAALVGRFLAGETGKVATGGVPAEGEINGVLKNLSTSSSPDQIKQAGATLLQIAAGRATPLMEKAKEAHIDNIIHVVGPDATAILQKNGYDPTTLKPTGGDNAGGKISVSVPGGKTYHFKTQADADAFKKSAGIQ